MFRFNRLIPTYLLIFSLVFVIPLVGISQVQAQDSPALRITDIDVTNYPEISASVLVDTMDLGIDADEGIDIDFALRVDDSEQVIDANQQVALGRQMAFVLDASSGSIHLAGNTGIPRYIEVANGINGLLDSENFVDGADWLASVTTGAEAAEFTVLSGWSQDAQLVRDALQRYQPVGQSGNAALYDLLDFTLDQFEPENRPNNIDERLTKAVVLFSNGFDVISNTNEAEVIRRAAQLDVQIYTILLGNQPEEQIGNMQRLAEQTGGFAVTLTTSNSLEPLWGALNDRRETQQVLTFRLDDSVVANEPNQIEVIATLPNGIQLTDSATFPTELPTSASALATQAVTETTAETTVQSIRRFVGGLISGEQTVTFFPITLTSGTQTVVVERTTFFLIITPLALLLISFIVRQRRRRHQMTQSRQMAAEHAVQVYQNHPIFAHDNGVQVDDYAAYQAATERYRRNGFAGYAMPPPYLSNGQSNPSLYADDESTHPELVAIPAPSNGLGRQHILPPPVAYLVYADEGHLPARFALYDGQETQIGRQQSACDLVIPDRRISRIHATIHINNGRFYIRDKGSSGGTFVNMYRLERNESRQLSHNELIQFNTVAYRFEQVTIDASAHQNNPQLGQALPDTQQDSTMKNGASPNGGWFSSWRWLGRPQ